MSRFEHIRCSTDLSTAPSSWQSLCSKARTQHVEPCATSAYNFGLIQWKSMTIHGNLWKSESSIRFSIIVGHPQPNMWFHLTKSFQADPFLEMLFTLLISKYQGKVLSGLDVKSCHTMAMAHLHCISVLTFLELGKVLSSFIMMLKAINWRGCWRLHDGDMFACSFLQTSGLGEWWRCSCSRTFCSPPHGPLGVGSCGRLRSMQRMGNIYTLQIHY